MLMSAAAFYRKVLGNGVGSSLCRSRTGTAFPSRVQVGTNYSTFFFNVDLDHYSAVHI